MNPNMQGTPMKPDAPSGSPTPPVVGMDVLPSQPSLNASAAQAPATAPKEDISSDLDMSSLGGSVQQEPAPTMQPAVPKPVSHPAQSPDTPRSETPQDQHKKQAVAEPGKQEKHSLEFSKIVPDAPKQNSRSANALMIVGVILVVVGGALIAAAVAGVLPAN